MMILLTLEGLPHSGKSCILRHLVHLRPGWTTLNVAPEGPPASGPRVAHMMFAALIRKARAVSRAPARPSVVLLNTPWFEHMPRQRCTWALLTDMTHELAGALGCRVGVHAMCVLQVPHDETFEQMVCCGNPFWNGTSLADVLAAQRIIARHVDSLEGPASGAHPFPSRVFHVDCPPFFDENEVVVRDIAARIAGEVDALVESLKETQRS